MKILIVTYAARNRWAGGVFTYYESIIPFLRKMGHEVFLFDGDNLQKEQPGVLRGIPFVLKGTFSKSFAKVYQEIKPDAIHIQAEFGIGIAARRFCVKKGIPFTAAYHTNLDKALQNHRVPSFWIWSYLRWFYKPAACIHVHTPRLKNYLKTKGIKSLIAVFPPGVDKDTFYYKPGSHFLYGHPKPYFITLSRISKEKNIEAFLKLDLPGTKFVIGEGREKAHLLKKYGHKAIFLPYTHVAECFSEADVFVFPSIFDTFGLTIVEALSCGLPVAAYPVMGPKDIIHQGKTGYMSYDLKKAAIHCLSLKKEDCIEDASHYSWEKTAENFLNHQVAIIS